MASTTLEQFVAAGARPAPLSVEQYHRMIEAGILREGAPIELLGGILVFEDRSARGEDAMTVGKRHRLSTTRLIEVSSAIRATGHHLQIQAPITIPPDHEPEPDAAIVSGIPESYRDRHPHPGDVACVIEVSDSSLSYDRTAKAKVYATSGIPRYVIVNLQDDVVEVHWNPDPGEGRYAGRAVVRPGHPVRLLETPGVEVDAAFLLGL